MGNSKKKKPNWSKIGRQVKRRGKTYERRCAKLLTEHTGYNFRSTPASGGFNKTGGVMIREELFCGDLICDNPKFSYCVEAKNRKEFSFTALIKNPDTAKLTLWWYQCVEDARRVNLKPILFFKPNNKDDFVGFDRSDFYSNYNTSTPHIQINAYGRLMTIKPEKDLEVEVTLPNLVILDWKLFVKDNEPELMFGA